jgi:hypothetical protein
MKPIIHKQNFKLYFDGIALTSSSGFYTTEGLLGCHEKRVDGEPRYRGSLFEWKNIMNEVIVPERATAFAMVI